LPVKSEYVVMRRFISGNYQKDSIHTFHFIRPAEDFFEHKYSITRSCDEFGVPSGIFNRVPEYFTRQLVVEKTNSREISNGLVIKSWPGMEAYLPSGEKAGPGILVIDTEKILNGEK
jgi:hypothetical protein